MTENAVIPMDTKEKNTKVMHVISGLHIGGAEMMLHRLLEKSQINDTVVVSLTEHGELAQKIRNNGIEVIELKRGSITNTIKQLLALVEGYRPSVIQSWLYRADLVAGLVGRIKSVPVIWNVRQTHVKKVSGQNHIWLIQRMNAILSTFLPKKIVYCAQAAKQSHENIGFSKSKGIVINNGIDVDKYQANEKMRLDQRQKWDISQSEYVIGMVGRFDPLKNHARFIRIVHEVIQSDGNVIDKKRIRAVLVGRGMNQENDTLNQLILRYRLQDIIVLIDEVEDVVAAFNAMDLHILTSDDEGWPNVLGEALSVGLPCITTNVGDVSLMMADKEAIIDVKDEDQFVKKVIEKLSLTEQQRQQLSELNRDYIQQHCSLEFSVKAYDELYCAYHSY